MSSSVSQQSPPGLVFPRSSRLKNEERGNRFFARSIAFLYAEQTTSSERVSRGKLEYPELFILLLVKIKFPGCRIALPRLTQFCAHVQPRCGCN